MPSFLSPEEMEYEVAHIHDNRASSITVSSVICISLATIAVLLRLLARRLSKAKILADDYMMIFALVICMGQVACCIYSVYLGAGKHVILLKDPTAYAKTIIAMEVLYCIGTAAFKFSALLLFHRIFGVVPRFTTILWCFAFFILADNTAEVFLSIFQCVPVNRAWDPEVPGSCVNILLAAPIPGAINVFCDVFTVLLPLPLIWTLNMERNRKIQLVGIFLLSGFVCIASTYRTIIVKRLSHHDASWADVDPIIWAVVENAIGIVSASLPTLRPIYSLLVRGHHCTAAGRSCDRCCNRSPASRFGSGLSPGSAAERAQRRAAPSGSARSWFDEPRGRGEESKASFGSCDEGSLEKGREGAVAVEMY